MYGFPLTSYLLVRFFGLDRSHLNANLWSTLLDLGDTRPRLGNRSVVAVHCGGGHLGCVAPYPVGDAATAQEVIEHSAGPTGAFAPVPA